MLAAIGVVACFLLAAIVAANPAVEKDALMFLFPGIFVVWLPTVLLISRLTRDFKQRDFWKAALRGCPGWMKTGLWVVIGFVFAMFFLPFLWGSDPGKSPSSFVVFPATFYAISFCVMYSLIHAEKIDAGGRCLNGHRMLPLAKYCEECGAPAVPKEMQGTI
ncbi:MAG TPA: hypothetical protein VKV04_16500 [Verrucomicrobiae bacterium]|nr:hypothetical protein [Verrucomicrobiae bacterium]